MNFRKLFTESSELWQAMKDRDDFKKEYLDQMDSCGVDVILCPGQLLPAPPTGVMGDLMIPGIMPYIPWNLFNFPAGMASVTRWSQADADNMRDYPGAGVDLFERMIANTCDQGAVGMPLSVQVSRHGTLSLYLFII